MAVIYVNWRKEDYLLHFLRFEISVKISISIGVADDFGSD
jgi:hypothetical protein